MVSGIRNVLIYKQYWCFALQHWFGHLPLVSSYPRPLLITLYLLWFAKSRNLANCIAGSFLTLQHQQGNPVGWVNLSLYGVSCLCPAQSRLQQVLLLFIRASPISSSFTISGPIPLHVFYDSHCLLHHHRASRVSVTELAQALLVQYIHNRSLTG